MFSTEAFRITTAGGVGTIVTLRGTARLCTRRNPVPATGTLLPARPQRHSGFCVPGRAPATPTAALTELPEPWLCWHTLVSCGAQHLHWQPACLIHAPGGATGARAKAGAIRDEPGLRLGARGRCAAESAYAGEPERRHCALSGPARSLSPRSSWCRLPSCTRMRRSCPHAQGSAPS